MGVPSSRLFGLSLGVSARMMAVVDVGEGVGGPGLRQEATDSLVLVSTWGASSRNLSVIEVRFKPDVAAARLYQPWET